MDFTVQVEIKCQAEKYIKADSWEEALAKAKTLKTPDFISHNDGDAFPAFDDPEISAIFQS